MLRPIAMAAATALLAGCISIEEHRAGPAPAPAAPAAAYSLPFGEGSRAASEQPAGDYVLDGRHASVTWRLRHAGVGIFVARFDTITGKLTFDSADPANSSISVTIPANSVNTGVLDRNGARAFDTDIHTQAFGSAAHPEIKFVSRSIAVTGPNTGTIVGDLTLKGVTKPVTIDATFEGGRFLAFRSTQMIAFTGRTVINRKDFGASLSNPLADGFAGDQVEILIAAEFLKE